MTRIPTNFEDYLRNQEKRIRALERRPVPMAAGDLLGPGLAAQAVQIMDWDSEDAVFNGFFHTEPGGINTPDPALSWTGQVIAKDDGTGMQQVWNTDGPYTQHWTRTYAPDTDSEGNVLFTEWKRFATATGLIGTDEIDPDFVASLPTPEPTDGAAPTVAPVVTPIGGIGSMFFRWTESPNADPVTYRLHVAAGVTPALDGTDEVASGVGLTFASVRTLTDGSPIVGDGSVIYHAIVTAEDDDNATLVPPVTPVPSAEVTAIPAQVTSADIATNAVTTDLLVFNDGWGTNLTGETMTGATFQTRSAPDLGIKIGEVKGATNYDEALIVFNAAGVPFLKAVPDEELAVIAGEVKATTETVVEGASLGGITEITRGPPTAENPSGTPGAVRLTAGTTAPKSAPTVTTGYDTVQFTNDNKWGNRSGWSTDGTYWYTVRQDGSFIYVEKWATSGTKVTETKSPWSGTKATCVVHSGKVYVLSLQGGSLWYVDRFTAATMAYDSIDSQWTQNDGNTRAPAIGIDTATGQLLIAQARPSDATIPNRVRIRRYALPTDSTPLSAGAATDSDFAYNADIAGVTYGPHDLGANRYIFTGKGSGQTVFRLTDSTGAEVVAEQWPNALTSGKVGFTYASRTVGVFVTNGSSQIPSGGAFTPADVGSEVSGTGIQTGTRLVKFDGTNGYIDKPATQTTTTSLTLSGFKSMDATGLMRTYTGQDKATGTTADLTKWVANTLANATAETEQSPRYKIVQPKRTKLNLTTSTINTTGANAPDRVRIYIGRGSTDPGRTKMERQADPATGVITTSYSSLAAPTGTNPATNPPPATGNFPNGTVQGLQGADGTVFIDGLGAVPASAFRDAVDARANAMSAARMQAGTASSGIVVAATAKVVTVTFPTAFSSAPKVTLTGISSDPGVDRRVAVVPGSETTTQFQIAFWRATGTASFDTNWLAVKP